MRGRDYSGIESGGRERIQWDRERWMEEEDERMEQDILYRVRIE